MSIKDLFDKGHSLKFVKNKTKDDLADGVESYRYVEEYSEKRDRFVPDIDFATASNFARFGLAEEYYDQAIKRVYQTYPYDGSQAERIQWENESTYLDLFIYENEYPRTNGHITINETSSFVGSKDSTYNIYSSSAPQYVLFKGGPHADPAGDYKSDFSAGPSHTGISKANIYHTASQRTNNLEFDLEKGVTVEFWLKKTGWASTDSAQPEYLFSLWNSGSVEESAATNGSLRIYSFGSTPAAKRAIKAYIISGSTSIYFNHETGFSDIADGDWHHYAFTAKTKGASTISDLYVDGTHVSNGSSTSIINPITGPMVACIGGLAGPLSGSTNIGQGWGLPVSASFDEFRYWKTERDAQQIGRFYRDQIGGGTNTDNEKYDDITNKIDLGVYYKFNEGITGESTTDASVLDYSGRISNGAFINYDTGCRGTGSAMVLAGAATKEFKDPILYATHPDVVALETRKQISGSAHDHLNSVSLYKSLPGWIMEDDEKNSDNLKYLTQIMASFFDDLYLQIEKLPRLKDINYPDDKSYEKPLPFAERLLTTRGYDAPELFADASDLAKYLERGERVLFEKKLYEIKNIIYQNIYNNLSYIQKSKGTFKSLRNFLRCFGVDEELIKLNIYSNNDTYEFKNNETHASVRKKYIDFDDLETRFTASGEYNKAYTATAYQYHDSTDSNSLSYIPGVPSSVLTGGMMTIETEVIFPKRSILNDKNYGMFPSVTSSIFGLHAVNADNEDLTFNSVDSINFNFGAFKTDNDLRNVKFGVFTSGSTIFTPASTDSSYLSVYDNERWNFAFRIRPTKSRTDSAASINSSPGFFEPASSAYTYEFYGVNYLSNILQNEFTLTGSLSLSQAELFFAYPKKIFVGSARENFTGSIEAYSDVKVSSTRVWLDYLSDDVIKSHAKDALSHGAMHPYRNSNDSLNANFVPQASTLILNWTMDNITGSNSSGRFLIEDFASGSIDGNLKFGDNGLRDISRYNYSGRGDHFTTNTNFSDQAVDVEFVQAAKLKIPEVVNSDDMVKILNKQDDVVFTRDTTYIQHLLSVEKSMYQIISEEMLRLFASVTDFNNIVGEPVNRYRPHYKRMEKIRSLFFESVENERLDLEKFIEYFKWIDDSVTMMIAQLIPASSNTVDLLRNMVESHVLERNKYWTKFPTLEVKAPEPIGSLKAIEELKYNWKFGHAPIAAEQNTNQDQSCLWWKQRAERNDVLSSGVVDVDLNKDSLLKIAITEVTGSEPTLKTIAGTRYVGPYYYNRSLARPIDLVVGKSLKLKGGGNSKDNNLHDFYKGVIKWGSDDDFIYLDADNELKQTVCNDKVIPDEINKKKFRIKALTMVPDETTSSVAPGTEKNDLQYSDAKTSMLAPFSLYTSSQSNTFDSSYKSLYSNQLKLEFANIHEDKYGIQYEIPMQGPFTEKYVGGMQHRHIDLNQGADTRLSRAEGWHLQEFLNQTFTDIILSEAFTSATTTATTDVNILNLPRGSTEGQISAYEYWENGTNADNAWTFLQGPTPSAGTGPSGTAKFAYCEVLPSKVGQTFALVTPLIDMLDVDASSYFNLGFIYHMHGLHIGSLKIQASTDRSFQTGVEDLLVTWDSAGSPFLARNISGQQHANSSDSFKFAVVGSRNYGLGLSSWYGKRFYIRFLYTAGIGHLGDCAIDSISFYKSSAGVNQNSFKLMHPTYDDLRRPYATLTRDTIAKRPVNIRNIHMTGNSPTVAGNFLNRYEYVNTTSPEANDPYFVKNTDQINATTPEIPLMSKIENILSTPAGAQRTALGSFRNFTLPDRSYLSGTVRNKTRIKTRFSSPGGFETITRGFLDPAHETYSVYNVTTYRSLSERTIHNTQLQAHCGQFGASTHGAGSTSARVYGINGLLPERTGSINAVNYIMTGDPAKHKQHRNNIERVRLSGSGDNDFVDMAIVTASLFDNAFVSHMIPRLDNQTRWITASLN